MTDDNAVVKSRAKSSGDSFITPTVNYVLYLVALFSAVPMLLGVIFAYVANPADEVAKNHYRYQIRTFWIALLYTVLGWVFAWTVVALLLIPFAWIFVLVRSFKGLSEYNKGNEISDVTTWLW